MAWYASVDECTKSCSFSTSCHCADRYAEHRELAFVDRPTALVGIEGIEEIEEIEEIRGINAIKAIKGIKGINAIKGIKETIAKRGFAALACRP